MQQETIKNFFSFIKKPNYESLNLNFPQKLKELLKLYLITIFLIFLTRMLIELLIFLGAFEEYSQQISKLPDVYNKANSYIYLIITMVFSPLFEEIAFRLLLTKYNKKFITISLSLIIGYFLTRSFSFYLLNAKSAYFYNIMSYGYPICFALPCYAITNRIKFDFELTWNKYYRIIFYSMTIVFALMHLQTLTINSNHYSFLPILILPFIILGISLGYIRSKLGILYAIGFHFFYNLPMIIKIFIKIS